MDETRVVTVFLRNGADVLLLRRSEAVGSYTGRWGTVAGHAEGRPDEQARIEIEEETGLDRDAVSFVRRGDAFAVEDDDRGTRWIVTPYLFDAAERAVDPNEETTTEEWAPPTELLRRETVPDLFASYWRVAPTVETVREDETHGSAYLSLRALEVLRDRAALATERGGADYADLATTARELVAARPGMAAVRNRVDRAMATAASTGTTEAVERAAMEALEAAIAADRHAAAAARDRLEGEHVVTISRSGTVLEALETGSPTAVSVAESRPGGEGVAVAEDLATSGLDVTLSTDANLPAVVADASLCLVGADTLEPDGTVVNKVGTRALALAARDADVPCLAVCSTDKIAPGGRESLPSGDPSTLYDGEAAVRVENPRFERVPPTHLDGVLTEAGILDAERIGALAAVHAARARWRTEE